MFIFMKKNVLTTLKQLSKTESILLQDGLSKLYSLTRYNSFSFIHQYQTIISIKDYKNFKFYHSKKIMKNALYDARFT